MKTKAGTITKAVKVIPQGGGTAKQTVKVTLLPGNGYQVGTNLSAKIKILP